MKIHLNTGQEATKTIDVNQTDTIDSLRHKVSAATGMKFFALSYNGQSLQDHQTLSQHHIKDGAQLTVVRLMDIGVFDHHVNSPCRQFLINPQTEHNEQKFQELIKGLRGNQEAEFFTKNLNAPSEKINSIKNFADLKFNQATNKGLGKEETDDLKIELTREMLVQLIGEELCHQLQQLFAQNPTEILIRRCQSHGKMINFHTDVSMKTLQLSLNSDSDYQGGRLLYLTKGELVKPKRDVGTVTIHNNQIVHGVTLFESGVRYGLFFLQK